MSAKAGRAELIDTSGALLEAAARVFCRRGYHGATVREIAEEAGFTNPVLYYHFRSKEGVYRAVIRGSFERFEALVAEALEQAGACGPIERLRAVAAAYLRFGREDPVRLRMLYQEIFRPQGEGEDPELGFEALRARSNARIELLLGEAVARGVLILRDQTLARRIFVGLLGGLLVEQAREPEVPHVDERLADVLVRVFVRGIAALEEGG